MRAQLEADILGERLKAYSHAFSGDNADITPHRPQLAEDMGRYKRPESYEEFITRVLFKGDSENARRAAYGISNSEGGENG